MPEPIDGPAPRRPTRTRTAAAIAGSGWRLAGGSLLAAVPVVSAEQAVRVVELAVTTAGQRSDGHLHLDIRPGCVLLRLQTETLGWVSDVDTGLATDLVSAFRTAGLELVSSTGHRSTQVVEFCIDAVDIPAVQPFWKAVLGYVDEADPNGLPRVAAPLIDPAGQGPSLWFQQMDLPRTDRNRIHFDVIVGEDEAEARIAAALAAGGRLLSERAARAFWILADVEDNEVCVCTWQDRE